MRFIELMFLRYNYNTKFNILFLHKYASFIFFKIRSLIYDRY